MLSKLLNTRAKFVLEQAAKIENVENPYSSQYIAKFFASVENSQEAKAKMEKLINARSIGNNLINEIATIVSKTSL